MTFKKGDQVQIMTGKDRGKTGTVNAVLKEKERVIVADLNMIKKRSRPQRQRQRQKGETLMVARPIPMSNVMLVCKNCKKPTRMGARMEGDKKMRYCKKCDSNT